MSRVHKCVARKLEQGLWNLGPETDSAAEMTGILRVFNPGSAGASFGVVGTR